MDQFTIVPILPPTLSETNTQLIYTEYVEIILPTTEFILIATPGAEYKIKNKSGNPVFVAMNNNSDILAGTETQHCIGGVIPELKTEVLKYTWIRAGVANTIISIRPATSVDPSESMLTMIEFVNNLSAKVSSHVNDIVNRDHQVTKAQVGLGNLPNAKSSDVANDSDNVLASTKLTRTIYTDLVAHKNLKNNPHTVTKAQVNLGNVDNYPTALASNLDHLASTVTNRFVTPAGVYRIVQMSSNVAKSAGPQLVLEGNRGERPNDWMIGECDAPPEYLVKSPTDSFVLQVKAGLRVSFGAEYKVMVSEPLSSDLSVTIPHANGTYFVYVDINTSNLITNAYYTLVEPTYGTYREGSPGDFFNYSSCIMTNSDNTAIRRVYIGRITVLNNVVTSLVQVPIGNRYVMPLTSQIVLAARYLLDNPFVMKHVQATAEVLYMNNFHATGWNDQIGVMAGTHPADPSKLLVVQCGQMGFLCSGRESGNTFGSVFTSVTTPLRTRVVVERTLF